ncbi:MAG: 2-oxoacid:acceptor oxidoreductase [Deltaproteobacteria bacterium CG12_big_fil_rev_8_21_14_0_65_43_10]|nr:MAG: 2-oxoacid:acceptor oxidoreductase [Deltaproteobacteria bacterium CG12_big_fil_rev_8_21_14_0_65_43_10]HCX90620.1 2-oxoacid:acceptor oxidoreductase [Deltaproteobacteria bacterium]
MEKKKKAIEVEINKEFCKGCSFCVDSCPKECLIMGEEINSVGYNFPVFINQEDCTGCGACSFLCPDIAIEVYQVV